MKARRFIYATANSIALYLKREFEGKPTSSFHKKTIKSSYDTLEGMQSLERESRRIESILKYQVDKEKFKTYDSINIGVKL
jgi:hypothetical protein